MGSAFLSGHRNSGRNKKGILRSTADIMYSSFAQALLECLVQIWCYRSNTTQISWRDQSNEEHAEAAPGDRVKKLNEFSL